MYISTSHVILTALLTLILFNTFLSVSSCFFYHYGAQHFLYICVILKPFQGHNHSLTWITFNVKCLQGNCLETTVVLFLQWKKKHRNLLSRKTSIAAVCSDELTHHRLQLISQLCHVTGCRLCNFSILPQETITLMYITMESLRHSALVLIWLLD